MRILLIIDDMHPRSGGPPAVVAGSAIALSNLAHQVHILSGVQPGDEPSVEEAWRTVTAANVQLTLCPVPTVRALLGASHIPEPVKRAVSDADVVHIHGVWSPMMIAAGRVSHQLHRPYFVSSHGVFDHRAMTRIKRKWLKKRVAVEIFGVRDFLRRSAAVVFGSQSEAENSWLPAADIALKFVPNGADADLGTTAVAPADIARLHALAPVAADWSRMILCRSRIHEEKGIDLLVEAFIRLAAHAPGTGLLIAGLRQDLAYEARLIKRIHDSGLAHRIVLTTELTGASSLFLYQVCDIFVMPSLAEGFSMGLIEALANGCPMLITQYCHMPVVETAGAGRVVESTVDGLADGLASMLDRRTSLPSMGLAARNLFEQNYTWPQVAARLVQVYSSAKACSPA